MNDIARYLGAIYRQDNGASVSSIEFNDVEYAWDESLNLKGSNWANNGTTLVSVVVAAFQNGQREFELLLNDDVIIFRVLGV